MDQKLLMVLGSLCGILGGVWGAYISYKNAPVGKPREIMKKMIINTAVLVVLWLAVLFSVILYCGKRNLSFSTSMFLCISVASVYVLSLFYLIRKYNKEYFEAINAPK